MRLLLALFFGFLLNEPGYALPVDPSRNGVIRTGTALNLLLDESSPDSLLRQCEEENLGTWLFSNHCQNWVENLKRKIDLMSLETDILIQSEKLNPRPDSSGHRPRLEALSSLNLISVQALGSVREIKDSSDRRFRQQIREILPLLKKVQTAFEIYRKLAGHG